jgi:hypothetical protein
MTGSIVNDYKGGLSLDFRHQRVFALFLNDLGTTTDGKLCLGQSLAILGVRDITTATNIYTTTVPSSGSSTFVDSGALSLSLAAGDKIMVGVTRAEAGCSSNSFTASVTMSYQ